MNESVMAVEPPPPSFFEAFFSAFRQKSKQNHLVSTTCPGAFHISFFHHLVLGTFILAVTMSRHRSDSDATIRAGSSQSTPIPPEKCRKILEELSKISAQIDRASKNMSESFDQVLDVFKGGATARDNRLAISRSARFVPPSHLFSFFVCVANNLPQNPE